MKTRRAGKWLIGLALLAGCGSPKNEMAPPATSSVAPPPLVSAAPSAAEAPPPHKSLDADERARFEAAMAEGRARHKKKDYRGAMAVFDRALSIDPEDAHALGEVGWSAFFAKELNAAEEKTRAALGRTEDREFKGSLLYNLGRIAEERKRKADAAAFYQQSLIERPNPTVRLRLKKLDRAASQVFESWHPMPLLGPYATLNAFCAANKTQDDVAVICDPGAPAPEFYSGPERISRGKAPALETRVFWTDTVDTPFPKTDVFFHLAIRTKEGWFVTTPLFDTHNPGAGGVYHALRSESLELKDVIPGGSSEIVYRYTSDYHDSDMGLNERDSFIDRSMVVCGFGPSSRPSCTGAIPLDHDFKRALIEPKDPEAGMRHPHLFKERWRLTASFLADGKLELTSADKLPAEREGLLGAHSLDFP